MGFYSQLKYGLYDELDMQFCWSSSSYRSVDIPASQSLDRSHSLKTVTNLCTHRTVQLPNAVLNKHMRYCFPKLQQVMSTPVIHRHLYLCMMSEQHRIDDETFWQMTTYDRLTPDSENI